MSIKNILIGNNYLHLLGGSESLTYALGKELAERGYNIDVFSFRHGIVSKKMKPFARIVRSRSLRSMYDLAIVSHNPIVKRLRRRAYCIIQTCNGVFSPLEQPSPFADLHVSISPEVQDHLRKSGFDSTVIYNSIDCDRFKPQDQLRPKLSKVMSLSQSAEANKMIQEACNRMGVAFQYFHKHENGTWDIEHPINWSDLVISLGRGAYESMACGRSVLVYDQRSYASNCGDGVITAANVWELLKNNCSGRRYQIVYTVETLMNEMSKYNPIQGQFNREFAVKNLNIKNAADRYLKLANDFQYSKAAMWFKKKLTF